jgi:hypothetical protein
MALWLRKILTDLGLTPKAGSSGEQLQPTVVTIRVQLLC